MNPRTARRIEQLPIPQSTADNARLLAKIGACLLGDTCIVVVADGSTLVPLAIGDNNPMALERATPLLEPSPIDRYRVVRDVLATSQPASGPIVLDEIRAHATRGELAFLETMGVHSYLVAPLRPSIGVVAFLRYRDDRSRFYREHEKLALQLSDLIAPQIDTSDSAGGLKTVLRGACS
jgi:hypothetical protein